MKCKNLMKVTSFLLAFALMSVNVVKVEAYTDINGYPFVMDNFALQAYQAYGDGSFSYPKFIGVLEEQNSYHFQIDAIYDYIYSISFGVADGSYVVPINLDSYDYYIVGTFFSSSGGWTMSSIGSPNAYFYATPREGESSDRVYASLTSFHYIDFINKSGDGFSFYGEIDLSNFSNLTEFRMTFPDNNLSLSGDCWFSASIVPVPKSGTEADTLNSILQTLTQINQNIITGNTLQQQTIDAINANTTNNTNWFSTLFSNLSTWYTGMTDNLRNWFYMIDDRLNTGFSNLYNQMTKEQNELLEQMEEEHEEQLHGYDTKNEQQANEDLSSNLNTLETAEKELTDTAFQGMNEYTITEDVTSYNAMLLTTIPMVAAMMQSIFDSSGDFGILFSVVFTLTIVCMVIGLYRYRRD